MALTTVRSTGISSLPAISAANLTSIPAANITGTLPAISGANLTGIVTTNDFEYINGYANASEHSNVTIDNCFTSTYHNYLVMINATIINGSNGIRLSWQFRNGGASGAEYTSSDYRNRTRFWYQSGSGTGDTGEADWNNSSMRLGYGGSGGSVNGLSIEMNIYDPYSSTEYVHYHGQRSETGTRAGTAVFGGYVNTSTSFTGIFMYQNNNNSFNADYAVYGIKV